MATTVETPNPSTIATSSETPAVITRLAAAGIGTVVVASAALLALVWAVMLLHFHGDLTGFVVFGDFYAPHIEPPAGAIVQHGYGYDGQYFWRMAASPLLSDGTILDTLRYGAQEYRASRMLYPTLAWLLAGGQESLLPVTLQVVGWAAILGLVALMASVARRAGRSAWWGLALGLLPGTFLGMARDLADPLAVTLMIGALVALERRRFGLVALAGSAAVLTRETMMILPVALGASLVAGRMTIPARLKPRINDKTLWMPVVVIGAACVAWQAYATVRLGRVPALNTPDEQFTGPLNALVGQLHRTAHDVGAGGHFILLAIANPLYLVAICGAAAIAVWAASQRLDAAAICAALFAVVAVTQSYGDHWAYTRATAPLFAALAYVALQRGYGRTLTIIAAGVILLPLYPA
jgi:hypothetical protein